MDVIGALERRKMGGRRGPLYLAGKGYNSSAGASRSSKSWRDLKQWEMLTKQTGADVLKSYQDCWSQRLSVTGERLFAF
jgi:hypothetical protein